MLDPTKLGFSRVRSVQYSPCIDCVHIGNLADNLLIFLMFDYWTNIFLGGSWGLFLKQEGIIFPRAQFRRV